jgi:S1-C subfamily serine protease
LIRCAASLLLVFVGSGVSALNADEPRLAADESLVSIFSGGTPSNLNELRAMQEHVRALSERVVPATVGVEVGTAQGSGVIIRPDGYILTAAHVIGRPGQTATIYMHSGREVRGITLGAFRSLDAGLIKIVSPAGRNETWPYAAVGDSSRLKLGQWCLATGHPGGLRLQESPTLRLGRILKISLSEDEMQSVSTDCTLIGGDSGGPLFDLQGRVIGIHSRIAEPLTVNLHVPVNVYRESWTRMVNGENWGYLPGRQPFIGVQGEGSATDARIARVFPNSPAEKSGIKQGDVVIKFGGKSVSDFATLQRYVEEHDPGTRVGVVVQRGEELVELVVVMGRRQG